MEMPAANVIKRGFLYGLIGSVGCSALLGIAVILVGDFGELEFRVLLTSLTISAASLCGLSCGAALEAGRARNLPLVGIGLALVSAVLMIGGIWLEPTSEGYWKLTASGCIFSVAISHLTLLLLARLSPRFLWAIPAAAIVIFSTAGLLTVMIWGEFDEEFLFRLLGVAAILAGAVSIMIPVFHRLSRGDLQDTASGPTLSEIDREIQQLETRLAELRQQRERVGMSQGAVTAP